MDLLLCIHASLVKCGADAKNGETYIVPKCAYITRAFLYIFFLKFHVLRSKINIQ